MLFRQLFEPDTSTWTYLLADPESREAILIDPVREMHERDAALIDDLGLKLVATVDTHVHADHITGAWLMKQRYGSEIVLSTTSGVEGADRYVDQGDAVRFGNHAIEVRLTPGHTDGCASFVTEDSKMVFTGDALLIRGSGRTDFQQGDSRRLYQSIHEQVFTLPDDTLIYPGHDYNGRTVSTVGEEKRLNRRLGGGRSEDDFAKIMSELNLAYPRYIDVALPANKALGRLDGDPDAAPSPDWFTPRRTVTGVPQVTPDWVAHHGHRARLVDVREPMEFEGPLGHVPESELVPLGSLLTNVDGWNRAEPVVLICRSGGRSDQAAAALERYGFTRVASMVGGMNAWNRQATA